MMQQGEPVMRKKKVKLAVPRVSLPIIGYIDLITDDGVSRGPENRRQDVDPGQVGI